MPDPRNDDLLKRLQQGDEQALSDLADAYGAKIYQLAFRYLRNHEDAEEVTQDVLYKVFRKVAEFRGDAALSSWIYRITFNSAMSRLRSASYQRTQDEQRTDEARDIDGKNHGEGRGRKAPLPLIDDVKGSWRARRRGEQHEDRGRRCEGDRKGKTAGAPGRPLQRFLRGGHGSDYLPSSRRAAATMSALVLA